MTWAAIVVGVVGAGVSYANAKSASDDKKELIRNRPRYNKSPEYATNQALATNSAFGRDRSIMNQEANIDQSSADSIGNAQDYSTSTSGLLDTLSKITSNKNAALRGLASDEAAIQNQKLMALMQANKDVGEENDKAFNYNTNQPYQNAMGESVGKEKYNTEQGFNYLDMAASAYTGRDKRRKVIRDDSDNA